MDISGPNFNKKTQGNINNKDANKVETISLSHLGKTIDIDQNLISQACAEAAKNAYDLGETNDEDSYKEEMESMITEVLQEKSKKRNKK
tara:strand:+ start:184 stop:450 length:267 start_codon:yes stop_codon:yes gene_type:complete